MVATVIASSFASALELVREGVIELQQHAAFAPLYIRKRRRCRCGANSGWRTTH